MNRLVPFVAGGILATALGAASEKGLSHLAAAYLAPKSPTVMPRLGAAALVAAQPVLDAMAADAREHPVEHEIALDDYIAPTLEEQRSILFKRMQGALEISDKQMDEVRFIFSRSNVMGQGNPMPTKHPMKRSECQAVRKQERVERVRSPVCGAPDMVPIYDPTEGGNPEHATACIDQFEFPGYACEYPVVYARANEAAELCAAVGKRLCDAHEWEGACAGAVHRPEVEYAFAEARQYATWIHNTPRQLEWAYGDVKHHALCATRTVKSEKCFAGGWTLCGSNTYPAGSFPACVSAFGVYDQHGNAAEHMNLPDSPEELASAGGMGLTEMKGSWFIFERAEAHEDDCRWRAKDWHPSRVMDEESHRNYHLGFRCCKNVGTAAKASSRMCTEDGEGG